MYDFITTRSKPGTAKSGNSSTPIWTIFCWRFKLTIFTRMWKTANISMTQAVFPKIIHFTAQQTKGFWTRWKTRWMERQLLSVFALGQKFTQSRQRSKTAKSRKARKRMLWKKEIRHVHYKEMLFSKKPQTEHASHRRAWDLWGAGEQNLSDLQNLSLIQSDISQKTEQTHVRMDTVWQKSLILTLVSCWRLFWVRRHKASLGPIL